MFDVVVIGSGPGGYVAAIRAAQLGMRTAIVEREPVLGGRCLHWACIPAKTVLRSADILSEVREAGAFGIDISSVAVDFAVINQRRRRVTTTLAGGVAALLKKNCIEVVTGEARLETPRQVKVGDRVLYAATAVIMATGSKRRSMPGTPFGGRVIGTEEAWNFDRLPTSIGVIGAGSSGAEIASAYARLGSNVQLFEYYDRVLPAEDLDTSEAARRGFEAQGIAVYTSVAVTDIESRPGSVTFKYGEGSGEVEWLVVATGRSPDLRGLVADPGGLALTESGHIEVNSNLLTSLDGVYAIGDLVSGPALAHKASEEGIMAAETAAGNVIPPLAHADIPRVTFCAPNVASVGLTEQSARAAGYEVAVGRAPYAAVGAHAVIGGKGGMVKLVGERMYGSILGAHIIGDRAAELIQQIVSVKALEGGYPELARISHSHPTLSEVVAEAARAADGWLIHG
ncbi:MAG: dihydrolipoyl dehydrogenase [Acidimicrobiales bacterium]